MSGMQQRFERTETSAADPTSARSCPCKPAVSRTSGTPCSSKPAVFRSFSAPISANPPFSALLRLSFQQTRCFQHFRALFEDENCCNLRLCRNGGPKNAATCGFVEMEARKLLQPAALLKSEVENCCNPRVCRNRDPKTVAKRGFVVAGAISSRLQLAPPAWLHTQPETSGLSTGAPYHATKLAKLSTGTFELHSSSRHSSPSMLPLADFSPSSSPKCPSLPAR